MAPVERRGLIVEGGDPGVKPPVAFYSWITPGYLEALGVPILRGRGLRDADGRSSDGPVLVNDTAARQFWPDQDAVGKRLRSAIDGPWLVVAGVVGDVREEGLDSAPSPHLYAPLAGVEAASLGENAVGLFRHPHVVVSTTAPAEVVGGLLRQALGGIDPQLALTPTGADARGGGAQRLDAAAGGGRRRPVLGRRAGDCRRRPARHPRLRRGTAAARVRHSAGPRRHAGRGGAAGRRATACGSPASGSDSAWPRPTAPAGSCAACSSA